jgi:hypothetical protein
MELKKLAFCVLVFLLVAGAVSVSASAPEAGSAYSPEVPELAQAIPDWLQANSNGFGDPLTGEVTALETFNNYLYAGTHHPVDPMMLYDGARMFRSPDGVNWTPAAQPGFGVVGDTRPPAVLDLAVFNSNIYASTGRGNAAQIWRSSNGTTWSPMVAAGFGDPNNHDITALAVYDNKIYAGVANTDTGAQIWRSTSGGNNTWGQVAPAAPGAAAAAITGFAEFDGTLYATVESAAPAQIWSSFGGSTWTPVMSDGFTNTLTTSIGGMAVFGGYLYVGAGNTTNGALLYRTNDGTNWHQTITPAFGDPNNQKIETVFVYQNQLYASAKNSVTGLELWRSANGTSWEQANQDGFGDSNNTGTNWSNATADFSCHLYVGTSNVVAGGELWEMQRECSYIPFLIRLP